VALASFLVGRRDFLDLPRRDPHDVDGVSDDIGGALAAYEPPHPAYLALQEKLAELRAGHE